MTAGSALVRLRRFARRDAAGRCDLCGAALPARHAHLYRAAERAVACACAACAEGPTGGAGSGLRRLERRGERLDGLQLGDGDWQALGIPVRLAFLGPSVVHDRLFALYPNAGGTTEAVLPRALWEDLIALHPAAAAVEPDGEGLLVDGLDGRNAAYRLSIDVCYELVGAWRRDGGRFPDVGPALRGILEAG